MRRIAVGLAALALAASACGSSSGNSSSGSTAGTGGSSASSGSSASTGNSGSSGATASCHQGSGRTVKVLSILDESQALSLYLPDIKAGLTAGVHDINCAGGLGKAGSPVQLEFCDSEADPNQVTACARKATGDQTYVASVGNQIGEGTPGTLFAQAGLPDLPANVLTPDEATGATVFGTNAGLMTAVGQAVVACRLGYKKISEMVIQLPAGAAVTAQEKQVLAQDGCPSIHNSVPVPSTATDVSAEMTTASQGADVMMLHLTPDQGVQAVKVRQQLGLQVPILNEGAVATAESLKSLGSAANGMQLATFLPPASSGTPGDKQFLADMKAVGDSNEVDDNSLAAWTAVDLLATAAKNVTTVNRSTLLQALKATTSFDAGGVTPPLDFAKPGPYATYPRLFNMTVGVGQIKNGQIEPVAGQQRFIPIFGK